MSIAVCWAVLHGDIVRGGRVECGMRNAECERRASPSPINLIGAFERRLAKTKVDFIKFSLNAESCSRLCLIC
jgi:hypothetical protein